MRGPKKCSRPTQAHGSPTLAEYENFLQLFPQQSVVGTGKKW